ncbi:MAG: hypothetical protein K8S23_05120 [Candidatus Cloacimonetes bacterium]|nr:hypothetical protein [Candidatus Cloacimonadota bacterium]
MIKTKISHIKFSKKPIPLPAEYRATYKISQIVLILKLSCSGNKASLLKLHLLSWALKSDVNRRKLLDFIRSNFKEDFKTWGIEPALNRALSYAIAEELCKIEKGNYLLTEKGNLFYSKIINSSEVLNIEIDFLKQLGKRKITDNKILALSKKWEKSNDENK